MHSGEQDSIVTFPRPQMGGPCVETLVPLERPFVEAKVGTLLAAQRVAARLTPFPFSRDLGKVKLDGLELVSQCYKDGGMGFF